MTRARSLTCIAAIAAGVACSSDDLVPVSVVDTLRVLAVRADRPIAAPGETVHLDMLVADPKGAGRAIRFAWSACINPGSGEVTDCADANTGFAIGGPTLDYVVPTNALDGSPTNPPLGIVGTLFAACAGDIRLERIATAPVRCVGADGRDVGRDGFMWGEKRIVVANGVRNANPKISDVRIDGVSWDEAMPPTIASCDADHVEDCASDQQHTVDVSASAGSAELYDGFTEDLIAFFFVSDGRVADDFVRLGDVAFTTTLAATRVASGATVTVWLVLRDDRGGVDWQTRSYVAR